MNAGHPIAVIIGTGAAPRRASDARLISAHGTSVMVSSAE